MITTTLEQSKRLKELGAPQDTEFNWIMVDNIPELHHSSKEFVLADYKFSVCKECAAHNTDSLIEWLGDDGSSLSLSGGYSLYFMAETVRSGFKVQREGKTTIDALVALAEAVKGEK